MPPFQYDPKTNMHMKCYKCKEPTTCVALGAPVPLEMLGARLETYISKAAINTIRLCLRKLPVELVCNIVEEIQSDYKKHLELWQAANKCCQNNCECVDVYLEEHWKNVESLMARTGQRDYYINAFRKRQQV